jgi:hypothetical protein
MNHREERRVVSNRTRMKEGKRIPQCNKDFHANLRFEAVDALELHYQITTVYAGCPSSPRSSHRDSERHLAMVSAQEHVKGTRPAIVRAR